MAGAFTAAEWQAINAHLDADLTAYGLPERRTGSVVLASWNIRKLGALAEDGVLKKSAGASAMLARFCGQCDLIAIQEVQPETEALYALRDTLNAAGGAFELVLSDVTGRAPGYDGMAERFAFLYNTARIRRGDLASDLSYDRSAVVENINGALAAAIAAELPPESDPSFIERALKWITDQPRFIAAKLKSFVQFIRAPHVVEFVVEGPGGSYELYCVNAHLVSGASKGERMKEFFALLEWLLIDSGEVVAKDGKTYLLFGDLNLDFESNLDKRKLGVETYITDLNKKRGLATKVNFPFLDGGFMTNARRDQTFDHIAWFADDSRWPRGRHNPQRGTFGADEYDYGMFDFVQLFADAGPGSLPSGAPDYERFEHDFTDHMPIWLRMPIPNAGQQTYEIP